MDVVCLDFLNSEFRDFRGRWSEDRLLKPEWLDQFLTRWNLQVGSLPDAATLQSLIELRALLLHIVESLAHGQPSEEDIAALNAILQAAPSKRYLSWDGEDYNLTLVPVENDWNWVKAEIASSFAELLVDYEPERLKICENVHCRWIFYDESKSRTRRYCTTNKCANLWKLRRFRARHKENSQDAG